MSRCVIIGGADIQNYRWLRRGFRQDDVFVYCDSGLRHRKALQAEPRLIIGDFDSYANPHEPVETIVLPRMKDDTDTMYAVKEGIARGFDDFLLIGVTGGRLDHTLGNLSILLYLEATGCFGKIMDDYSEMEIVSRRAAYIPDSFAYFSLLSVDGAAAGVDIDNAKYPLQNAVIDANHAYGISNEVLPGKTACVTVKTGRLLLIKVR